MKPLNGERESVGDLLIFISHRAVDTRIANALKDHLISWGVDERNIGLSSGTTTSPRIGQGITKTLVRALSESKLFFLVYGGQDADWSYCMWELGVASDPTAPGPRVIVLQCATEFPSVLAGLPQQIVRIDDSDLRRFVNDFHRQPAFVPELPAFSPWIAEEVITARATELHRALVGLASGTASDGSAPHDSAAGQPSTRDRVFLCHSSGDKPRVRALYEQLRRDGFNPWLDEKDLLGGQKWEDEIRKAIRRSSVVVICLSKSSLTKTGFVQKEIKIALDALEERPEGQVYVIPVRLEPCDIPDRLREIHYLDLIDNEGYEMVRRSLSGAIRGDALRRELPR